MAVTCPPFSEQTANALSDVDALIESLEQLIAKKRAIKQGAMQELLTGKRRLPGFGHGKGYKQTEIGTIPEDWDSLPARDFGVFKGGSGFPLKAQGAVTGGIPFFKVSDMNNEGNETYLTTAHHHISEQTRKRIGAKVFAADSIVFAKVGAAIFLERKKILGQPSCIDNNLAAFSPDRTLAALRYMHFLLLSKKLGALVATTALPSLNGKQLGQMEFALPPLPEQTAIATVLSDMDTEIESLETKLNKTRQIKQGMMSELLTGRIRLI
jgi:type I restriction enzyme S subunit